jgi:hypothetical protein
MRRAALGSNVPVRLACGSSGHGLTYLVKRAKEDAPTHCPETRGTGESSNVPRGYLRRAAGGFGLVWSAAINPNDAL